MRARSFTGTRRMLVVMAVPALIGVSESAEATHLVDTVSVPASGTTVVVPLAPGTYELRASGTYDYDTNAVGSQLADAECSTDHATEWHDPADRVKNNAPAPVSPWHRYRFVAGWQGPQATTPRFFDDPALNAGYMADTLDLAVFFDATQMGELPPSIIEWEPAQPTPLDANNEVDAGCNNSTHEYRAQVQVTGSAIGLHIVDSHHPDNAGSLTVAITRVDA